jgi:hypothetical protein
MEYIWLALIIIALAIIIFYKPVEKMTNKDLLATLSTFGKTGTKPKKTEPNEEPIYGPKTTKVEEPVPASTSKNGDDSNVYPDIYGPEVVKIPGQTKKKSKPGKHESDAPDDDTYEFNPDFKNAFPTDENEPQPFLTDYSKFQH